MGSMIVIYALYDPAAPARVRYIGKAKNPKNRLNQHIRKAATGKLPVSLWIRSVIAAGRRPAFTVLAYCTGLSWEETETRFIRLYAENGHQLCNVSGGGGAGYVAKRALLSAKLAGIRMAGRVFGARKSPLSKR